MAETTLEDHLDGCELDFTQHETKGTEIEDYLVAVGDEVDGDDD